MVDRKYNVFSDANPDGNLVGQSSTDLVGFWGKTPVARPATIADATNTTTTTSTTTALTTDLDSLRSKFNSLLSKLETIGILADS
jgi:hypothetical protein